MKNILILLTLILSYFSCAQSHRFIYEYKFVPDSTKIDSILIEDTRLDIFKDHSEFLSDLSFIRDSTISQNPNEVSYNLPKGNYKNTVYKSKKLNYVLEFIGIQPFKVIQNENLNWKLINEIKFLQGYECQKAILNYGNRKWEAWFTKEIPIQDGPYIFGELPGLIIQINDIKNQHNFSLVANYKTLTVKTNIIEKQYYYSAKISRSQFNKKWNIY